MPINPSFSATESIANPNEITFVDDSTGSDGTLTNRKIFVRLANGNWLTEGGESTTIASTNWAYSDVSITLSLLSQSTACSIEVVWYAGSAATYDFENTFCFNIYDYLFGLQLLQGNTSSPSQVQDTNYYSNLTKFIVNIFNEENPITYGGDIFSSQGAMAQNQYLIQNENLFF